MSGRQRRLGVSILAGLGTGPALAQARNPFGVGISEGGGSAAGITGWILSQQGWFEHQLSLAVRAIHASTGSAWPLVVLSFAYGVFHAAGPGHGKAVLTAYMVANERALRRGLVLSLLAALLQGIVAVALVGVLAVGLHATAQRMKDAASLVEWVSFLAIAALGAVLVWRKGRVLVRLVAARLAVPQWPMLREPARAMQFAADGPPLRLGHARAAPVIGPAGGSRFTCETAEDGAFDPTCAHCRAIDPSGLDTPRLPLRDAAATVFAAGLRPCSGAILVLVFALAQGVFGFGVLAVLAMAAGVALTTAVLACLAVFLKRTAQRVIGSRSRGTVVVGAAAEFAAAVVVLVAGLMLLVGATVGGA